MDASGANITVSNLGLNQPTSLQVGKVELEDVAVTGQWGFFMHGTRKAVFDHCAELWFFLFDDAEVLLHKSVMNEFDPRQYTGTFIFEDSVWKVGGEIIEDPKSPKLNEFQMVGAVEIRPDVRRSLSWSKSVVTREFPLLVVDYAGLPLAGIPVTLSRRGSRDINVTTGPTGEALIRLRFTDSDYDRPWLLTIDQGHVAREIDFFTSTPVTVIRH